jgi:hypothetical protein
LLKSERKAFFLAVVIFFERKYTVQDVLAKSTSLSLPIRSPEAKFLVPDWEDKVDSGIGLSYRPGTISLYIQYIAYRAGTVILCRVNYIPPVRD